MKSKITLLALLLISLVSKAQINYADIYDTHVNTHASRYFPSLLGTSFGSGEVNLINVYGSASNNAIAYSHLKDLIFSNQVTDAQLKDLLAASKTQNNFFVSADVQFLDFAFKVRNLKQRELFSLELGERERIMANIQLNKSLLSTALLGNEQYAGQTVSFNPTRVNGIYMHDFYLGVAAPIYIEAGKHDLEIRPGLRGSFLLGVANAYTQRGNASMYTDPEGKYITLNYDYVANAAVPTTVDEVITALSKGTGKGWGISGGVGFTLDNFLSLDLDVIDGGRMYFNQSVNNYHRNGTYQYNGVDADLFPNGEKTVKFNFNEDILNPIHTQDKYTTPFAPIITFRAEYRLVEGFINKHDSIQKYFQHHLFLTYVQGTQTLYNASTVPNISVGYMYSLKNILNLGLSMSFLGYNKFAMGPFLSVKGGPFVFSCGSNNLMALMAPKFGTGIDGYVNISFNFGKQIRHQRPEPVLPPDNAVLPPPNPVAAKQVTDTTGGGSQAWKPAPGEVSYRVQLIVTRGPLPNEDKLKEQMGDVSAQELPNGIFRYFGGVAKSAYEAMKLVPIAKANGYPNAFVVRVVDGKRIE